MQNLSSPPFKLGINQKILLIGAVFLILLFPFSAQTSNHLDAVITSPGSIYQPSVVINEISWMGTKIEGVESKNWWRYEWFELYNNTNQSITLDGWQIELYRTALDWSVKLKGVILPQNYFLIVSSEKISPSYDFNYSNLGGKFINSGQKVLLKNNEGFIADEVNCSSGWFAGDNTTKQTMERKNSQLPGNDSTNWLTSQNTGGTPKTINSVISTLVPKEEAGTSTEAQMNKTLSASTTTETLEQINYPEGIIFNEILPSPEGPDEENEWIEIFNQNLFEINLSKWRVSDTVGTVNIYTFPEGVKIGQKGFLVLPRPDTKITLNNGGDSLKLIQPNGNIIDEVTYEKAPQGYSYNRTESDWVWSNILTKNSVNILSALTLGNQTAQIKKEEITGSASSFPNNQEILSQKQLAAVSGQAPKTSRALFSALIFAFVAGIAILFLKKRVATK